MQSAGATGEEKIYSLYNVVEQHISLKMNVKYFLLCLFFPSFFLAYVQVISVFGHRMYMNYPNDLCLRALSAGLLSIIKDVFDSLNMSIVMIIVLSIEMF